MSKISVIIPVYNVEKYLKDEVYNGTNKNICFTVNFLIQNGIISSDSETDEYIFNELDIKKIVILKDMVAISKFVIAYIGSTILFVKANIANSIITIKLIIVTFFMY